MKYITKTTIYLCKACDENPIFMGGFIAWAAYAVYICASLKIAKERGIKQ